MKLINSLILLCVFSTLGCNKGNPDKEKNFKLQDANSVNVEDLIEEIHLDFLVRFGNFLLVDDYLVFNDFASINEKGIHLFDINTFEYITSTGALGRGPGEITRLGGSILSSCGTFLWVDDYGREVRWKFPIDSIINNKNFLPTVNVKMDNQMLLTDYGLLNDSIALGLAVVPLSSNSFEMTIATSNIRSGLTERYGYEYPDIDNRRHTYSHFKIDRKNERYIRCYENLDLMSICHLNGDLILNLYGPLIGVRSADFEFYEYFKGADIYNDLIVASYLGEKHIILEEGQAYQMVFPSKFLVFDLEGTLVKTIEVGNTFSSFCIDKANERVILYFDDRENPFGYFSLKSILDLSDK